MTKPASDISLSAYEEAALDRDGTTLNPPMRDDATGDGGPLSDDVPPYSLVSG